VLPESRIAVCQSGDYQLGWFNIERLSLCIHQKGRDMDSAAKNVKEPSFYGGGRLHRAIGGVVQITVFFSVKTLFLPPNSRDAKLRKLADRIQQAVEEEKIALQKPFTWTKNPSDAPGGFT
jgi:hypothetical protein